MTTLTLIVLGASREECAQSPVVATMADEVIYLANPAARWGGLGVIGNHYLETAFGDLLGLVHADTMVSPEVLVSLTAAAVQGVAGIVGSSWSGHTIWSANLSAPMAVCTLDSCAMFVSRALAAAHQLRFDVETFDSFHCCVEDFCLQAAAARVPVLVAAGSAGHPLPTVKPQDGEPAASGSPSCGRRWPEDEHKRYREKLRDKWLARGVSQVFTT